MDIKKALGLLLITVLLVRAWIYFGSAAPARGMDSGATAAGQGETASVQEDTIRIQEDGFQPHAISVQTGGSITWTNQSSSALGLESDGEAFGDPQIQPGASYEWQAGEPGVLHYTLQEEESVEGQVIVLSEGEQLFGGRTAAQEYQDSCSGCHGPDRRGGTGPALLPERLTELDQFYFDIIKNGRSGTVMPAWGEQGLSDKETWSLVGFIRSQPSQEAQTWELSDIQASHQVLVPRGELPQEPETSANFENLMLVTEREARSIAVFDADRHELIDHIQASYRAHGYVFHPLDPRWVYNVGRDGWLFKIDLYSMQAVTKVRVGQDSRGLAISDDGEYILAGNYIPTTAVILDAETLKPLKVIQTQGTNPDGEQVKSRVCITSDVAPDKVGPYFIIALKEAGQVWRINYAEQGFPIDKVKNVGHTLHDGFLSPDNSRFYIASQDDDWMAVIDVAQWELLDKIETGDIPHPGSGATWEVNGVQYGATVHAGEGLVTIWNLETNQINAQVKTSGPGLFIRSHDESPYVWADTVFAENPNKIYVIDKATFEVVEIIEEGTQTLHPEFSADGQVVYVSDWQEDLVRVYDAHTFEKIAEIGGVETPTGIFNTHRRSETLGH